MISSLLYPTWSSVSLIIIGLFNTLGYWIIKSILKSYNNLEKSFIYFSVPNNTKIAYGIKDIEDLNKKIFNIWGNIWNRIVRADIYLDPFESC